MKALFLILLSTIILYSCEQMKGEKAVEHTINDHLEKYVQIDQDLPKYDINTIDVQDGWKEYRIKMISGEWLTTHEVVDPEWWHWVNIIIPDNLSETEALMIIGGGSAHDTLPLHASPEQIEAAIHTQSIVASVSNVPFQPIDFTGDDKAGTYEDELIAYGWKQFLEDGAQDEDVNWLARLPMTRAVTKAMDLVEEISKKEDHPVNEFVVTGASKRGWTTWTTAIADDRVIAIIPVVIDLLNIVPSFHHHWKTYGQWSPAINNYVEEGIMDWMDSREFNRLLELVEPYSFIDSLELPKYMINATGDEFFLPDSWKFYWNDLKGEKYLRYVPNGNHGLRGTYNPESVFAFYDAIISEEKIPEFDWKINGNNINIFIISDIPYEVKKWTASNPEARDFRMPLIGKSWTSENLDMNDNGKYRITVTTPEKGYKAALVEVTFYPKTKYPLTFTSGTLVTPDNYLYSTFNPVAARGTALE